MASRPQPLIHIASTEGVSVALHDLGGSAELPPLLISHATGFHAHCYTPIANALADRFHCVGLDYRGHGDTHVEPTWNVDWARFGDDASAAARHVAPDGGLAAFGHSMGGAALLMAAHRDPDQFERLVLFEPISHQATSPSLTAEEMRNLPIVQGARRRRRRFESFDDAYENFRTKPPLSLMVDDALRNYVDHGFAPTADGEAVELRCAPEIEAGIFVTGRDNGVWPLLSEIETPTTVVAGEVRDREPSAQAESIANELPNGTYVQIDHQTHLGPFTHPAEVARLLARSFAR